MLDDLADLRDAGKISRIGAVVQPNAIGASTLAALSVAGHDLARIAALVSAHREVNHCYEREHAINLWFVITAPDAAAVARSPADHRGRDAASPASTCRWSRPTTSISDFRCR